LGSNSFQLRGFSISEGGAVVEAWGAKDFVRLSSSLDLGGRLSKDGHQRAVEAVARLLFASRDAAPLLAVATSAVRTAVNRADLLEALRRRFGLEVRVLSGLEEARLAYVGARANQPLSPERIAVIDVGGGSTQMAVGDARGLAFCTSAPLGTLGAIGLSSHALGDRMEAVFGPPLSKVAQLDVNRVVFSCGVARAAAKYLSASGVSGASGSLDVASLGSLASTGSGGAREPFAAGAGARHPTLWAGATLLAWIAARLGFLRCDVASQGLREGVALWSWASCGWSHPSSAVMRSLAPVTSASRTEETSGVRQAPTLSGSDARPFRVAQS